MSRYTIESAGEGIEIVVGWDRPLGSLFAQVRDTRIDDDESDPMLLWDDFASTADLVRAIAPWAALPDPIRKQLAVECGEGQATPEPPFERPERVVFFGTRCRIVQGTYPHGGIALQLFTDDASRAPFATPSACIPSARLRANESLIRKYGESEGILDVLVSAGVVRPTGRFVASGYVRIPVVEVLPPRAR